MPDRYEAGRVGAHDAHPKPLAAPTGFAWPEDIANLSRSGPVTPSESTNAWNALRADTDALGATGQRILANVRIFAQRQFEAGVTHNLAHRKATWQEPIESLLRAMAKNYSGRNHSMDALDLAALLRAADEIERLRK